jgi:hypothetical protein
VANGKLSRAQVGLALASALVVLLASGVAISRIAEPNDESPVATGPSSTSNSVPGLGQAGPATGSGPATVGTGGGVAEPAAQAAAEAASEPSSVTGGGDRRARKVGSRTAATGGSGSGSSSTTGATGGSGGTSGDGSTASGGGSPGGAAPGGGQESSPPAPSQSPPEPLASASVSVGQGAEGAVVGLGLGNEHLADPDVTIGSNPVVGDHPPSEGTGVTLGGRAVPASAPAATILTG